MNGTISNCVQSEFGALPLGPDYASAMEQSGISASHQPHYQRWLTQYYRFCERQVLPAASPISLDGYIQHLMTNGREQWQCDQARRAVRIAFEIAEGKLSPAIPSPAHAATSIASFSNAWDNALESTARTMKLKHLAASTLDNYTCSIRAFRKFMHDKNPAALTSDDARAYLEHLAIDRRVAASTQNGAFNALLFLYRQVLNIPFINMQSTIRAKRPKLLPTVLWQDECEKVLSALQGIHRIIGEIAYGCGLRVSEAVGIRIRDISIEQRLLSIKFGKGQKDRVVPLPQTTINALQYRMKLAEKLWREDCANPDFEGVFPPEEMEGKPGTDARMMELGWYWLFPATQLTEIERTKTLRRYHIHEIAFQQQIHNAASNAGILKRVTPHTLRHSFATHLLQAGYDIRQVQELLGHADVRTTMIYLHIMKPQDKPVQSPLDILRENNRERRLDERKAIKGRNGELKKK